MLPSLEKYRGKKICVALSGGADSVCLLHLFSTRADALHITLSALTCEHGIRGESSLRDLEFVRSLCKEWGIPLTEFSASVPERAKQSGRGIEDEARSFRYECFAEMLNRGVDAVATAHHEDDVAETVLFRLARGTSLAGLKAIRERDGIIRPLLYTTKKEIEAYVRERNLPFVTDESNFDPSYARNAIRLKVLPDLNDCVEGASKHLVGFARRAAEDDELLQALAEKEITRRENAYLFPSDLPAPLFRRAALICMKALGCKSDYTEANTREISRLLTLQSGKKVMLPCGLEAAREGDMIAIYAPLDDFETELPFGEGEFVFGGNRYAVTVSSDSGGLYADFDKFPKDCVIRTRREGDYITPFGSGTKSLKKFLTDRKVPARVGKTLPLVAKGSEIFAVFDVEISNKVRIDGTAKRAVRLIKISKEDGA